MATSKVPKKSRLTSSARTSSSSNDPAPKIPPKTGNVKGSAIQFTSPSPSPAPLPSSQVSPLSMPSKDELASGEKVLQSLIKKQKDKVVSVLERIATHNVDIITHGMEVSYEEYIKLHDEFLLSLNDKMENDVSEFRWVIDQYIKDLKAGRVNAPKNVLTKQELAEMGAIGAKEDLLRSAGSSISSFLRRGGPLSKQQLGIYDKLFEKQKQDETTQDDGFIGKALDKIQSFTKLFKDPEIEEKQGEDKVPAFDKIRFKKDDEYRKLMLNYTKDLLDTNKRLSKAQLEILRKVKKEEDLQKFVQGARERMTPGQQILYDMMGGLGRLTKNLVRNTIDKIDKLERETKQTADHEPVAKVPSATQQTADNEPVAKDTPLTKQTVDHEPVAKDKLADEYEPAVKSKLGPPTWVFPTKTDDKIHPNVWKTPRKTEENVDELAFEKAAAEDESDDARQDKILATLERIDKNIATLSESDGGQGSTTIMPLGGGANKPVPTGTPKPAGAKGGFISRFASRAAGVGRLAAGAMLSPLGAGLSAAAAVGSVAYMLNQGNVEYGERMDKMPEEFKLNLAGKDNEDKRSKFVKEQTEKSQKIQEEWKRLTPEEKAKQSEQKDISPQIVFERSPKVKTETVDVLTDTAETVKEEKRSAITAEQTQQIINAPQKNTVISGGSQQTHMKQNPRNPDNSFTSWLKTRIGYI